MNKNRFAKITIGLAALVGGCETKLDVIVEPPISQDDSYLACPVEREEGCFDIYDPVCGDDGRTYGNACEACFEVRSYKIGECE